MNSRLILKVYAAVLLIIMGGIVVHAPLSVGLGSLFPGAELLIKSWKELLLLALLPFGGWLMWHHKKKVRIADDRLLVVIILYGLLHALFAAALLTGVPATMAGLAIDLRFVLFFAYVYILIQIAPEYRPAFIKVAAVGAAIVVGFGVLQLFLPADILRHIGYGENTIAPYMTVDENHDYIRINSTMRGPNPLGAYMVIVISLFAAAMAKYKIDISDRKVLVGFLTACAGSIVTLWVSYSRSALAAAALAVSVVGTVELRHKVPKYAWVIAALTMCVLALGVAVNREHPIVSNVIFHEDKTEGNDINSNDGHVESLLHGTDRLLRQPIGGGVGSTGSASLMTDQPLVIENQYLFIAHEVGWLGLILFMLLFGMILVRLWRQRSDWLALGVFASGIGLAFIGMVLPVWVDDTVSIIWWGLAAVAIGSGGKYGRQSTNKKTARTA